MKMETVKNNFRYVFHLQDHAKVDKMDQDATSTSASVYSTYKQRIDSMFDETRSQSSYCDGRGGGVKYEKCYLASERKLKMSPEPTKHCVNTVQEEIEKMFSEMAKMQSKKQDWKEICHVTRLEENNLTENSFSVEHLGSVQLLNKVTSLQELQEPLKNLYFEHCRKVQSQFGNRWGKGTLEIARNGLKIHRCSQGLGENVQLNPFNTIAVWAAVKFVCRKKNTNQEEFESKMEYAFSPLIADPEAIDQNSMFQKLSFSEEKMILSALGENGFRNSPLHHQSPMFIIVMRKIGVPRQLECHGFICACSEDAIVIAANLYQALIKSLQTKHLVRNIKSCVCKPNNDIRNLNEIHKEILSDSGISNYYGSDKADDIVKKIFDSPIEKCNKAELIKKITYLHKKNALDNCSEETNEQKSESPIRPPRQNKKLPNLSSETKKEVSLGTVERNYRVFNCEKENENNTNCSLTETIQQSVDSTDGIWYRRKNNNKITLTKHENEYGDVLTKIAIPHSKSFLNANGPLKYFSQQNNREKTNAGNKEAEVSPLGLNELFREFRMQEGLDSMDEILDAIIDAEGMSFNDLKPLYKEFLFKLAVTLSKDELYQRSKFIMRRQKKKRKRRKSCCKHNKFSAGSDGLRRVFRHSLSKFRKPKSKLANLEFTSVLFPSEYLHNKSMTDLFTQSESTEYSLKEARVYSTNLSLKKRNRSKLILAKDTLSSNVPDGILFHESPSRVRCNKIYRKLTERSENHTVGVNRSSSGYVSCSDCSYDTESCTCSSAEKCYCSREPVEEYGKPSSSDTVSPSECASDTDSCLESNKCYCAGHKNQIIAKPFLHTKKRPSIRTPLNSQINTFSNTTLNISACEELSDEHHDSCFQVDSFNNKPYEDYKWANVKSSLTVQGKKHEKIPCLECGGNVTKNVSDNLYSTLGLCSLCEHKAKAFRKRMNVYACVNGSRQNLFLAKENTIDFSCRSGKSEKCFDSVECSDTRRSKVLSTMYEYHPGQQKVLVVSARDQMGRVIYMGATSRDEDYSNSEDKNVKTKKADLKTSVNKYNIPNSSACEALSVKKSAEIAALFSDVKLGWTTDKFAESTSSKGKESSRPELSNPLLPSGVSYYLDSDLENSLGYFP